MAMSEEEPALNLKRRSAVGEWDIYFMVLLVSAIFLGLLALCFVKLGLHPGVALLNVIAWWIAIAMGTMPLLYRFLQQMSVAHLVVVVLSVGAFFLGHFKLAARDNFPMMSWYIFTGPKNDDLVTCREMFGVFKDGKEKRLLVEQIFPSIIQFNLPLDVADKRSPSMPGIITAIGQEYNRLHQDAPVVRIDLRELAVPIRPTSPQDKPVWTPLESYTISSAPSKS